MSNEPPISKSDILTNQVNIESRKMQIVSLCKETKFRSVLRVAEWRSLTSSHSSFNWRDTLFPDTKHGQSLQSLSLSSKHFPSLLLLTGFQKCSPPDTANQKNLFASVKETRDWSRSAESRTTGAADHKPAPGKQDNLGTGASAAIKVVKCSTPGPPSIFSVGNIKTQNHGWAWQATF